MNLRIAITDGDWFRFLSNRDDLEEVNFWQPSGSRGFRALEPGEPMLFKLHSPRNFIVGGGFFAHASKEVPVSLAWETFREANGAATFQEMRARIERYRRSDPNPHEDYRIGCILLYAPFFFERERWIPVPDTFSKNIQQGKNYDATEGDGRRVWAQVQAHLWELRARSEVAETEAQPSLFPEEMFGDPMLVRPRLGQGSFRFAITDTYRRRCALTGEKALPVLDAAHIRPVSEGGDHQLGNGLLLRSDVHRLYDRGYVTVTPEHRILVSGRLKDEFDNGEPYYPFHGKEIWVPPRPEERPSPEFLEWHATRVFR